MRPDEPCVHERENTFPLGRFFFVTGLPCAECEAEAYAAWVESVRDRLTAGLKAADAGEAFDWNAPKPDDRPPFALVCLDDRIDLALTIDDDGRCTVPVAGRFTFGRVTTLQEAADAARHERVMQRVRHGLMTLAQARQSFGRVTPDVALDWRPPARWLEIDRPMREGAERTAAWIRERIEEDRLVASDAEHQAEWHSIRNDRLPLTYADVATADEDGSVGEYMASDVGRSNAVHMAVHDPQRVLRQCGALSDVLTELERIAERAPHPDPQSWARLAIGSLAHVWGTVEEVEAVYLGHD